MNEIKVSRELGKRVNRSLVLNLIKDGPISRLDIAERSGLSAASVSNLTAELIDEGLVRDAGVVESRRGRPPSMLSLNSRAGYVAGVKVMADSLVAVVTDLDASVVAHRTELLDEPDGGSGATSPSRVLELVAGLVDSVAADAGLAVPDLLGVGLGIAGPVDSHAGVVRYSPFFGWRDVSLAGPLSSLLGVDVFVENDVNSLTIAEQWFGHGRGVDNFAVVTVGRGVGLGLVINGQFYGGSRGGVGELGHVAIPYADRLCGCGRRGCLEAMASDPALLEAALESIDQGDDVGVDPEDLSVAALVEAAENGNTVAEGLLANSGRWLGAGVATVVNLLNPELVIVAGEGVDAGELRLEPMRQAFSEGLFDSVGSETRLVVESAGDVTWARGAACVVLSEFFKSPLHRSRPVLLEGVAN